MFFFLFCTQMKIQAVILVTVALQVQNTRERDPKVSFSLSCYILSGLILFSESDWSKMIT